MHDHRSLLTPLTLPCGVTVVNRFLKSAMSEGLAEKDHAPNGLHQRLYQTFAEGGAGIVVTGNVMVDATALGEPGNVVLDSDAHLDAFKAWAKAGTTESSALWVQLNHPGKQAPRFISKDPVAPSAIRLEGSMRLAFKKPRALLDAEIKTLVKKFARSAALVKDAGFGGVQIHAAHGYLISQFLSPKHNQRSAPYGGSLPNRMRFLMEIYAAMRDAVGPSFPIGVKMNIDDFMKGGFTQEDALHVMQSLSDNGIDLIELSGGSYENPKMMGQSDQEGFFLALIEGIKKDLTAPLVITGGFRSTNGMASVITSSTADMIGLARPLVIDPSIPQKIAEGTFERVNLPRIKFRFKSLNQRLGPILGLSAYEVAMRDMAHGRPARVSSKGGRLLIQLLWSQGMKALIRKRR